MNYVYNQVITVANVFDMPKKTPLYGPATSS